MTEKEALYEMIRKLPAKVFGTELYCTAYDMAIKAMEKRVKQKPSDMTCPGCGAEIKFMPLNQEAHPVTYCWLCGQAIDWSEVK